MAERVPVALALACLVVACGRTGLDDLGLESYDAGSSIDASVFRDGAGARDGAGGSEDITVEDGSGTDASGDGPTLDAVSVDAPTTTGDGGASGCNPSTCPATCCLPDGTCVQDENEQACGSGGTACKVCGPDEFCKGDCTHYQDNCSASNCPGCCETANICAAGESNYACGHAGEECQRCVPAEGTGQCTPLGDAGGTCEALTTCSPANCTGCCSGNVCLLGDADQACGSDGAACVACSGADSCTFDTTGQYGAKNHYVCAVTSPCGPSTCTGCCEGLVCAEGNQDVACGAGGAPCANCQSAARACTQGACR